jgi:hypothetical protein
VGKLQFIHCVVTEQRDRPSSTAAAPTVPLPEGSQPPAPANEPADEPPNEPVNEPANGPANGPEPDQSQTQMQSQQQNAAQF